MQVKPVTSSHGKPRIAHGPSRDVYDVAVAGGQLGGALAAALLAKRGYKVLLVEHDGLGPGYEHGGYLLPFAPFIAPPMKAMPVFDEVLAELGLATAVQRALKVHSPDLQLIFPRARVDLWPEEPRRVAELKREFPDRADAIHRALKAAEALHEKSDAFFKEQPQLPPEGFLETFGVKRHMGRHPGLEEPFPLSGDDPAVRLLAAVTPFVSYLNEPSAPLAAARPFSQAMAAPTRYPGGREGLRELLCKKLIDLGGDVLTRDTAEAPVVEELLFDGSKAAGIKLVRNDHVYRARYVIGATDAGALRRLITDKKKQRGLLEQLDLVTTKKFLFSVNWVIEEVNLPRGMGDLALVETDDQELGPLLIQVNSLRRMDTDKVSETERVVCAGAFVPASTRDLGEEHLAKLAARIGQQLDALMPFSREKVLLESSPYLDAGGVRGSRLLPHPLYQFQGEQLLGITGLPQRTAVKNLFLASREVLPGLGLEGEILSGVRAARLIQESLKKSDPLKR